MLRSLFLAVALGLASSVQAADIWSINQGYQNQINSAFYYQRPYYSPYYGGWHYPRYGSTAYEVRRLRESLEDYRFEQRWSRWNDREWRR